MVRCEIRKPPRTNPWFNPRVGCLPGPISRETIHARPSASRPRCPRLHRYGGCCVGRRPHQPHPAALPRASALHGGSASGFGADHHAASGSCGSAAAQRRRDDGIYSVTAICNSAAKERGRAPDLRGGSSVFSLMWAGACSQHRRRVRSGNMPAPHNQPAIPFLQRVLSAPDVPRAAAVWWL
jgi:hypothetical protein